MHSYTFAKVEQPDLNHLINNTRCSIDGAAACMGAKSNLPPQPPSATSVHYMHIHIFNKVAVA